MSVTDLIPFDKNDPSLWQRLWLSLVIILVALLSFGLGKLSGGGERGEIKIDYNPSLSQFMGESSPNQPQTAAAANSLVPLSKPSGEGIVASKNGSKYHFSYCSGAKQIKEENKISFNSTQEAEAAGYTLAANCIPR